MPSETSGSLAGRIAAVSEQRLEGRRVVDASGLVVAPGFIDLHQHGQSLANYEAQVRDGITTSLELEIGVEDIDAWYRDRQGKALVNYGASISHPSTRGKWQRWAGIPAWPGSPWPAS